MELLNLDQYEVSNQIKIKGITYLIPPISYGLGEKFMKLDKDMPMGEVVALLVEYLNTNEQSKVFSVDEVKTALNMKQIMKLAEYLLQQLVDMQKN